MSLDRSDIATWVPGYTYDTDTISIDRTEVGGLDTKGLTAAEAHATTGDIGEVVRTLLECAYQNYVSVAFASRPTNFRVSKSSSIDPQTGVVSKTYSIQLQCESEGYNVIAEPV